MRFKRKSPNKSEMEKPRDNPRRPSNQSGVYEQPYGPNRIYNEYFDPFNDKNSTELKKKNSVRDSSFIKYNLYSSVLISQKARYFGL